MSFLISPKTVEQAFYASSWDWSLAQFDKARLLDMEWEPCKQHFCPSCRVYRIPSTRIVVHARELSRMEVIP